MNGNIKAEPCVWCAHIGSKLPPLVELIQVLISPIVSYHLILSRIVSHLISALLKQWWLLMQPHIMYSVTSIIYYLHSSFCSIFQTEKCFLSCEAERVAWWRPSGGSLGVNCNDCVPRCLVKWPPWDWIKNTRPNKCVTWAEVGPSRERKTDPFYCSGCLPEAH